MYTCKLKRNTKIEENTKEKEKMENKKNTTKAYSIHIEAGLVSAQDYRGITLIALVITIIILLILAGVVLNLTLGEHGILKMAEQAGKNYVNVAEDEQKKLGDLLNEADNIINSGGNGSNNSTIPPQTYPTTAEEGKTTHTAKHIQYTWEELNSIAKVISDNYGIEAGQINNNTAEVNVSINGKADTLGIGDWAIVNGKQVRILGFNHDELADQTIYGGTNTYAGISFEFAECIITGAINSSATNTGGWRACELRGTLNSMTYESLENKLYIKEVNKQYIVTYNVAGSVTTTQDKLWLISCSEVWNVGINGSTAYGRAIASEGKQYKSYKDIYADPALGNDNIAKKMNNSNNSWWLRSPTYNNGASFCCVTTKGVCVNEDTNQISGIAPGFAI